MTTDLITTVDGKPAIVWGPFTYFERRGAHVPFLVRRNDDVIIEGELPNALIEAARVEVEMDTYLQGDLGRAIDSARTDVRVALREHAKAIAASQGNEGESDRYALAATSYARHAMDAGL